MDEFQPTNTLHRKHFWFLIPLRYCWVRLFCFEFFWLLCIMMRTVARTLKNLNNNNNENNNSRDYWSSLTSSSCCSHHSTVLLWKRAKSSNIRRKAAWLPRWKYFRAATLPFFIGWTLGVSTSDNSNSNNNNNNSNWTYNLILGVRRWRAQKNGSDMIWFAQN